jgi:protein-tyrosine phosphatase
MIRILVVCMGNICRSPLAESVLQAEVVRLQLTRVVQVDSAGTYAGHQGEKPDRRAVELAKARGYAQIEQQRARRVTSQDFESFDLILAMDRQNLKHLQQQCPPQHQHKLHLFLVYAGVAEPEEVPDPYYGNAEGFSVVLDLCEEGGRGVLRRVALELA